MTHRRSDLDMAKGLGILAVLVGHTVSGRLHSLLYSFHMPLFFLISGYLLSSRTHRNTLMRIYAFTCACLFLGIALVGQIDGSNSLLSDLTAFLLSALYGSGNPERYGIGKIGPIWFLPALCLARRLVSEVKDRPYAFVYILSIACIGYLSGKLFWMPMSLQSGMVATVYVYLGYLARENSLLERRLPVYVPIVCLAVWIAVIIFSEINMAANQYTPLLLSLFGPICGVYLIICLCKKLLSNTLFHFITSPLCFYGRNTLPILWIHTLELKLLPWSALENTLCRYGFHHYSMLSFVILFRISLATLAVLIVRYIPILQKIFTELPKNSKKI